MTVAPEADAELHERSWESLSELLEANDEYGIAGVIEELNHEEHRLPISRLTEQEQTDPVEKLSPALAADLLKHLPEAQAADILEVIAPESAANIVVPPSTWGHAR